MSRMPDIPRKLPIPANDGHASDQDVPERPPLLETVEAYIEAQGGGQGRFSLPVPGINIIRSFQEFMPPHKVYRPSLCVTLQGRKEIHFGGGVLRYGAMQCLVVSVELPAAGRIAQASPTAPFVGITIDFDVAMLREVAGQLDTPPPPDTGSGSCIFVADVDARLADCIARLVTMAETPASIDFLHPLVMREICYWLLRGPHGAELRKLALPESHSERIGRAIYHVRERLDQPVRIEELAEIAGMSASSFHQHFKTMTSMTPLQYQKQLRLLEARRLMVADAATVNEAAYRVGYESASQFSREYARAFGTPPKRDVMTLKSVSG